MEQLTALENTSVKESKTSQVVLTLKEVYDALANAQKIVKNEGVHVEKVHINDLHVSEVTSSIIDPKSIAIKHWLLEQGPKPTFVVANDQTWVVSDFDTDKDMSPKEALYTTFKSNMNAVFGGTAAHVSFGIQKNKDGLSIEDLSLESADKALLKLDSLHFSQSGSVSSWSGLKWMPHHDHHKLLVPWVSSVLNMPMTLAQSPKLKSHTVAITFQEIVDDMNTGLQAWFDAHLTISPMQWLDVHHDLSIDALNTTQNKVDLSGISLSDHVNTLSADHWTLVSEDKPMVGAFDGALPHDDLFGLGNIMLPATIKHNEDGLTVLQTFADGRDQAVNQWSTEQPTAFIQFNDTNGTFTEELLENDHKKIEIKGARNTGTQSLFAVMPIGTATWESKKGQFYRFNMMDNEVFQQNGTQ